MAAEFKNLGVVLPKKVEEVIEINQAAKELLTTLTALDKSAASAHKENNMRIEWLKTTIQQWIEEVDWQDIDRLLKVLSTRINLVMAEEIWDEWGIYKDGWFAYIGEKTGIHKEPVPLTFHERGSPIYIGNTAFLKQYIPHFDEQLLLHSAVFRKIGVARYRAGHPQHQSFCTRNI